MTAPEIPLLTLDSLPSAFLRACSTTGFLHLALPTTGPLTAADVKQQFAVSSHLYDEISLTERERFSRDDDSNFNGHTGVGSTYLNREGGQQKADWKEGFGYGRFPKGGKWDQALPQEMERHRADMQDFQDGCYDLMLKVLDKLSLAFNLPEDYFRNCHKHQGANSITLLNYPPPPAGYQVVKQDIRAGAHKDWGSVTLLFQEEGGQPGLEVFLPDPLHTQVGMRLLNEVDESKGTWVPAPIIPNTVLINLGLMMEAWTAGQCVATLHRVTFPRSRLPKARRSVAYFGTPDPNVLLQPVHKGGVVDKSRPAQRVKEFFEERLEKARVPKTERKELATETVIAIEATA